MRRTPITPRRLAVLAAAILVAAFTLAACGSNDEEESSASATADWVDGFCGALTKWKGSLESVGSTLKDVDELSKSKIEQAADDVSDANTTLAADLEALGEPPKTATAEANDAVDDLRGKLDASAEKIKGATKDVSSATEVLEAVNTASAELLTMSSDISTTVATLGSLDAADEWKQAFADSETCDSLGTS